MLSGEITLKNNNFYYYYMLVSGYRDRRFEPWLHQYVVSLRKTFYLRIASVNSAVKLTPDWEHSREGCLFSAMSSPEEIALKSTQFFAYEVWWTIATTVVEIHPIYMGI